MSKQKDISGPGITSVLILGVLSFLLGGALAVASLISKEVPVMTRAPEPDSVKPGDVYFVRGDRIGRTAWRAKEDAWRAGMVDVLRLSETELNQWSRERLEIPEDVAPAGEEEASGFFDKLSVKMDPANFNIVEDKLQIATEVSMEGLLKDRKFIYMVTGTFKSTPAGIRFVPEKGTLGAAPLGSVPVARDWIFQFAVNHFENGAGLDWVESALEEVDSVEFEENQLVLRRRADG